MEAVLPKNINYLDVLPKAIPAERKRRNFFAANGTQYRPGQTMIIEVQDPRSFLDPVNSFLRFSVTNQNAAGDYAPELGGGYGLLQNFRVQQAGNTIMNIQNYSRLYCGLIAPVTGGSQWKSATSVYQNVGSYGTSVQAAAVTTNDPATAVEFDGGIVTSSNCTSTTNPALSPGVQMDFCVPLVGGLFSQDKLIPLPMLNQPIQLIFDLNQVENCGAFNFAPVAADLLISNVRYCAEMVEVPRDVIGFLKSQQEAHGGALVIQTSSYEYSRSNLAPGATGTQILEIPSRKKSIKSIQFLCMADASTVAAFAGAAASAIPAGSGAHSVFNQTISANPCLVSYQLRAGSMVMPPTAINGPGGRSAAAAANRAGSAAVAGLPNAENNKGESAFELCKAFGHLGSMIGQGGCGRLTYANPEATIAGGQFEIGTNWVVPQGQAGPAADGVGVGLSNLVGAGVPGFGYQWKFCPFAIDLEAYQNEAVNSGLDTKTLSLQMQLHLEIDNQLSVADGGNLALSAGQSSAINVDVYAYHDILYFFNSDGTITFSD